MLVIKLPSLCVCVCARMHMEERAREMGEEVGWLDPL